MKKISIPFLQAVLNRRAILNQTWSDSKGTLHIVFTDDLIQNYIDIHERAEQVLHDLATHENDDFNYQRLQWILTGKGFLEND